MNTCFRSLIAVLAFCTLVCADETPFLQTPSKFVSRTGTDKSRHADRTPPKNSKPESRQWEHSIGSEMQDEAGVVRLYSLNMIPNTGHRKPDVDDNVQQQMESNHHSTAGYVRLTSSENESFDSAGDLPPLLTSEISLVRRQLTIEGPLEVVFDEQESRREFGIAPVPVMPSPPMPVLPEGSGDEVAEAITGNQRPEFLKPLSGIRLSDSKPLGDSEDPSQPLDRALQQTEGRVGMLDMTPPPPRYFPQRNSYPIKHNPLYFEDPNLERCGLGHGCLTDAASLVRLAGRVPLMTYMMAVNPPHSCVRAKPDCPTCHGFGLDAYVPNPGELDVGAAALHAAVVVGVIFLIP
jgi:hypothetical protein